MSHTHNRAILLLGIMAIVASFVTNGCVGFKAEFKSVASAELMKNTSTPTAAKTISPSQTVNPPTGAPETEHPTLLIPEVTPYPYTTPLPPPTQTVLDGVYAKVHPGDPPVGCRRCADWKPDGGPWTLRFDKGIYRVRYQVTGWRVAGSFTVTGDQLVLFNDPTCYDRIGLYTWTIEENILSLKLVKDECAIGQRAKNLVAVPWISCQPPSMEAAITDHWVKPPGCN